MKNGFLGRFNQRLKGALETGASELLVLRANVVLLLPHIPVQTLGQALEPVIDRVTETDGGNREAGSGDGNAGTGRKKKKKRKIRKFRFWVTVAAGGGEAEVQVLAIKETKDGVNMRATQLPPKATLNSSKSKKASETQKQG